jgi:signal peptidase I
MTKTQIKKHIYRLVRFLRRWRVKRGLSAFCISLFVVGIISEEIQVIYSKTNSLPENLFIRLKNVKPCKGNLTMTKNDLFQGNIIKRVIGTSGDHIWYDDNFRLWVNDFCVGEVKIYAASGKQLTPIPQQTIPDGVVFLYAPHLESFDSRYQEVGLVPLSQLQGKILAVF